MRWEQFANPFRERTFQRLGFLFSQDTRQLSVLVRCRGVDDHDRLVDARENDLDGDHPATLADLEGYAEATSSRLVYLALEILRVRDPAAAEAGRHVGIAYALTGLLRAMPFHARAGRCYIPAEIAARAGLADEDQRALRSTPGLRSASAELAAAAWRHLATARHLRRKVPRRALPALLPAVIAERALARLRRADYDLFDRSLATADPLQSWRLAAAFLFKSF